MNPNALTLNRLYTAFAALDSDTMASCYADDATFSDPVFSLAGRREIGGMWGMLCSATRAKGMAHWRLEFSDIRTDESTGQAHWEARYLFSVTGRQVHNLIDAEFTFTPEGLIATHRDHFNFWHWSRQALGTPGVIVGWTPFLRNKVRAQANNNLEKYLAAKV